MTVAVDGYEPTDRFFGAPVVDVDEVRGSPIPHRYIHGGFGGTDTRFVVCFPEGTTGERFIQPLEGALGGNEHAAYDAGMLRLADQLDAFVVASNQGHVGVDRCPAAGDDSSIYGFRASAESARFGRWLGRRIHGVEPRYGYVYGPSGGARRSILCLENIEDVWDGAFPYMMAGPIGGAPPGRAQRTQVGMYSAMFDAQRVLGADLARVVDAQDAGGHGNPFAGLTTRQRQALETLYRMGFPRGSEIMLAAPAGQMMLWFTEADNMLAQDPAYFREFWSEPGHLGRDDPSEFAADLVDGERRRVAAVVSAGEVARALSSASPRDARFTALARYAAMREPARHVALALDRPVPGYWLGASVTFTSGAAAGRGLYCAGSADDALLVGGSGADGNALLDGVVAGDDVVLDNRAFLAFCHFYRHHVIDSPVFDHLRVDGGHVYPQGRPFYVSPLAGPSYSARFHGRMLLQQHTHDTACWPSEAVVYERAVTAVGAEAVSRLRVRWLENAEHAAVPHLPSLPGTSAAGRFVDHTGSVQQGLHDLVAWVEEGVDPGATRHESVDGRVVLPATASDRGGIQPVVDLTVAGATTVRVRSGESVQIELHAEVPPGAGGLVAVDWDLEATGTWLAGEPIPEGAARELRLSRTYVPSGPGTYVGAVRVASHRAGDRGSPDRRVENIARLRIVVEP